MLLPRNGHSAGHGTPQHLMATDRDGINGFTKGYLRRPVDEGHHHGKQGPVAVDVISFSGDVEVVQNPEDAIEVVHGSLNRRPDVDVNDDRSIPILLNFIGENIVVDLAHGEGGDGLGIHPVIPSGLEDGIMRLLGRIEDSIGMTLPGEQDAVQIPLGSAGGDVPPVIPLVDAPEVGEEVNDRALELPRVHAVVGGDDIFGIGSY